MKGSKITASVLCAILIGLMLAGCAAPDIIGVYELTGADCNGITVAEPEDLQTMFGNYTITFEKDGGFVIRSGDYEERGAYTAYATDITFTVGDEVFTGRALGNTVGIDRNSIHYSFIKR